MNSKLEAHILFYENNKMKKFLNKLGLNNSTIDSSIINETSSETLAKSIIYQTLSLEKDYLESDFTEDNKLFNI